MEPGFMHPYEVLMYLFMLGVWSGVIYAILRKKK